MLIPFIESVIRKQTYQNSLNVKELSHDIFVKTYYKLNMFDSSRPILPWVHSIVKNHMIDLFRKRKVERCQSLEALLEVPSHILQFGNVFSSSQNSPEDIKIRKEEMEDLYRLVGKLSEYNRKILLGQLEGKTIRELATENNTSVNAISIRIFRAKKELRNLSKTNR